MQDIELVTTDQPRVDSRLLAERLGNKHQNVFELIKDYQAKFERLGVLRFQTGKPSGVQGGRPEKFALLNEDQAFFLLTLVRNSEVVVELKLNLVIAFADARRAAAQHGTEYLPTYHELHQLVEAKASGSSNIRRVHQNVNKLINKTVDIPAGTRNSLTPVKQSLVSVAQQLATNAMSSANDHHDGYQNVKVVLGDFNKLLLKA